MKRRRKSRRKAADTDDSSDDEIPVIPAPAIKSSVPAVIAAAPSKTSIADMLAKQSNNTKESKAQPVDLTGIDPSFWAPVTPAAAAASALASSASTPLAPAWVADVAAAFRAQSTLEAFIAVRENNPPAICPPAALHTQAAQSSEHGSAYVNHLRMVVHHAISSPHYSGLLTCEERRLAINFMSLDLPAAALLSRLFQRKGPWFRLSSLRYAELTGKPGWWEREDQPSSSVVQDPQLDHGIGDGHDPEKLSASRASGVEPHVHAAAMTVAVRTLIELGLLIPLPGFRMAPRVPGAGAVPSSAAADSSSSLPPQQHLLERGVKSMASGAASSSRVPPDITLCLEAVSCCFTVVELRALLAQLGGVGAGAVKVKNPQTPGAVSAKSRTGALADAAGVGTSADPPLLSASRSTTPPPPTRLEMLRQLTTRTLAQRTVFGGYLPLAKAVLSCIAEYGNPVHSGDGTPMSNRAPAVATPGTKAARGRSGVSRSVFSSPHPAKSSNAPTSASCASSVSPLVRVSREAYAMLRRAHCLFYLVTATANLSSGQGTGAWCIAGGAWALWSGLPPLLADTHAGAAMPVLGSPMHPWLTSLPDASRSKVSAALSSLQSGSPLESPTDVWVATNSGLPVAAASAPKDQSALPASASSKEGSGRAAARSQARWSGGAHPPAGSRHADTASSSDSFIPAGAGIGAGALSFATGQASEHLSDGQQLLSLSSGDAWPNSGLYSPGLLQTFRKLDFALYECNAATRIFPTVAHFRLFEAAHLFRAQVDCVGVFGMVHTDPTDSESLVPVLHPTIGVKEHLDLDLNHRNAIREASVSSQVAPCINVSSSSAPPLLAGLQLLPYAGLLAGVPLDIWAAALDLEKSSMPLTARNPTQAVKSATAKVTEVVDLLTTDSESESVVEILPAAEPKLPPACELTFVQQSAASLTLAVTIQRDGLESGSPSFSGLSDLCGPLPPALLVGAASLRLILRICGDSVLSALGTCIDAARETKVPALGQLTGGSVDAARSMLSSGPALLAAYRVSLAAAVTQLWYASPGHGCERGTPNLTAHPWLHQLTAPSLFTALLWEAVDPLERSRRYTQTLPFLAQLTTACAGLTPHRSGRWWSRLVLNASHLGLHADAVAAGRAGLQRPHVRAGERLMLHLRTERLERRLDSLRFEYTPATSSTRNSATSVRVTAKGKGVKSKVAALLLEGEGEGAENDGDAYAVALAVLNARQGTVGPETLSCTTSSSLIDQPILRPEDPDIPMLHTLRAACDAARMSRGEPPLDTPCVSLRIDGFVRRALNRVVGQKSVFMADFDEDNDGSWADAMATAAKDMKDLSAGERSQFDVEGGGGAPSHKHIRLLSAYTADADGNEAATVASALCVKDIGESNHPSDDRTTSFENITLDVCAAFGWTYPHGPGHPRYIPALALGSAGSERIYSSETCNTGDALAAEVAPISIEHESVDDMSLLEAADVFFGAISKEANDMSMQTCLSNGPVASAIISFGGAVELVNGEDVLEKSRAEVANMPRTGDVVIAPAPVAAAPQPDAPAGASLTSKAARVVRFGRGGQRYFTDAPTAAEVAARQASVGSLHLRVGVEALSLAFYAERGQGGGWCGSHCEGGALMALAALLLWPVIWAPGCSDAFLTPFQDGPLDWDTPEVFYRRRQGLIRARLLWLAAAPPLAIRDEVGSIWRSNYGRACRGLRWDAYPLQLLQLIATGLGGGALAAICDALAWNHKQLGGGLPDLLLWRVLAPSPPVPRQEQAPVPGPGLGSSLEMPSVIDQAERHSAAASALVGVQIAAPIVQADPSLFARQPSAGVNGLSGHHSVALASPSDAPCAVSDCLKDAGVSLPLVSATLAAPTDSAACDVSATIAGASTAAPFAESEAGSGVVSASDHSDVLPRRPKESLAAAAWPDLQLPIGASVEVRLIEVKGPRDRLSEKQHVWLRILLESGVGAAVCKITEPRAASKAHVG